MPGHLCGLWLEEVRDTIASAWPVERFGIAAAHLGEFSGLHTPGGIVPSWPWLRRADWRAGLELCAGSLAQLRQLRDHPLVRRAYPHPVADGLQQLWESRRVLLDTLDTLPYVVCHGDAQRRNLFAVDTGPAPQTVSVDWANVSAKPVGGDIATLVHQAMAYFDIETAAFTDLDRVVVDQYFQGLATAGWVGDWGQVRFAYATQMALSGLMEMGWVLRIALEESRQRRVEVIFGRPAEQVLDRRAAMGHFFVALAREAFAFVPSAL